MELLMCSNCEVVIPNEYHAREHLKYHENRLLYLEQEIADLEGKLSKRYLWKKGMAQADQELRGKVSFYWGEDE